MFYPVKTPWLFSKVLYPGYVWGIPGKEKIIYLVWNSKILEPLIKSASCKWIGDGKVGVGKFNTDAAIIDYGDGTCDNNVSLIINGVPREITLH